MGPHVGNETSIGIRERLAVRINAAFDLPAALHPDAPALDKYRLQSDPEILGGLAALIADQLPADTEVLAGVEVGGIAAAAAVALHTGLPWALARRERAGVHISRVVGTSVVGRRTVLVKDAALGGGSLPPLADSLRDAGADVSMVAVGLAWNMHLFDVLEAAGLAANVAMTIDDLRPLWEG